MPDALADSKACLSSSIPALNTRMTQHLTERCCRFLKSASEVPRLYRRTNKVREAAIMRTNVFLQCFLIVHSHMSCLGNAVCLIHTKP